MALGRSATGGAAVTTLAEADGVAASVHAQLLAAGAEAELNDEHVRQAVIDAAPLLSPADVRDIVQRINQMRFGFGPLEPLLADDGVDEIMVNGPGPVWVERSGTMVRSTVVLDQQMLQVIIERIIGPLGLRVDRTSPFVDARLSDGSRVNVAVPPLAIDGPYVTIRRFRTQPFALPDFCSPDVAAILSTAVGERRSMLISGGTGSGKTSLLNALAAHIPAGERVITIEDAAELRLPGEHIVRLESRPGNAEGVGHVPIRSLVRNALRMRPDRLIVGEVRGAEALDMIQAMNTGHAGSLSTCHANSAGDALRRVESMALMSGVELPHSVVRDQLVHAVDLVVHVNRLPTGKRSVQAILECAHDGGRWLVRNGQRQEPAISVEVGQW